MHVLLREVTSPEAEDCNRDEPVGEQNGNCFFDEASGRCVLIQPPEVGAEQAGDDPRSLLGDRATIGENCGKLQDRVTQPLQMILEGEIDGDEYRRHDQVDFHRRECACCGG